MIYLPHRRKAFRLAVDPNTLLLCHFDGSNGSTVITDSAGRHTLTAVGDAKISTAQAKFGQSLLLDGNDYVTAPPSTDFNFSTDDFTWEMFVRLDSLAVSQYIMSVTHSATAITGLSFNPTNGLRMVSYTGNFSVVFEGKQNATTGWAVNTWHHVGIIRSGTNIKGFLDGDEKFSITSAGSIDNATELQIGATLNADNMAGHIDELRISNVARWTSNFTPPTAPY